MPRAARAASTAPPTRRPGYLPALLGYAALTLLMLAPLLPHLGGAVVGGKVAQNDAWQNVWNLWWVARALAEGRSPFTTPLLYYPEGTQLYLQTLNVSNGVLAAPVTWLAGPVAGYNWAVVLGFALTGLGGYALGLRASGSRAAAFAAGLLLTFSPFHMTKLWDGQLELIALQWVPLYALFLLRAAEGRRWRDALLAGAMLALVGYTSWYYFLFSAVYSALFGLIWLARPPERAPASGRLPGWLAGRAPAALRMAAAGALGALLLLPILLPALRATAEGGREGGPNVFSYLKVIHSADLVDFWLPSALHPLWGGAGASVGQRLHPYISAWNLPLGYVAVALSLAGLALRWRAAWRWGLVALGGLVLALGPLLQVNGAVTGVPMPYALLARLPGVDMAHRPSHFVVIAVVALAPLAAVGMAALLARLPERRRRLAAAAVCALLLAELAPPAWPLLRSQPHPYYARVAAVGGAVLDLPPRLESSAPLEAQLVHGLPLLGGYVSRTPDYPFGSEAPVVRDLWQMRLGDPPLIEEPGGPLATLAGYGVRHVIVHWDAVPEGDRAHLREALAASLPGLAPAYEDSELTAYVVPEAPPRVFAYLGEGWYDEERHEGRLWRWMGAEGDVVVVNPTGAPAPLRLTLRGQGYAGPRAVALTFAGRPAGEWRIGAGESVVGLRLLAPPGVSLLRLSAPTSREDGGQRDLSVVLTGGWVR